MVGTVACDRAAHHPRQAEQRTCGHLLAYFCAYIPPRHVGAESMRRSLLCPPEILLRPPPLRSMRE